ncbi:MAG: archaeosortase/exosortase family protein [Chitinophagales bacterium]|nr:archaeosortase/exosortase family protein [Chitinophagales bacterium]
MTTIAANYRKELALGKYLFILILIWLSWKGIIWVLGEELIPIEQRMFPELSAVWESFNVWLVTLLVNTSHFILQVLGYQVYASGRDLWIGQVPGVNVGNYCLGLQLMYYFLLLMLVSGFNRKYKAVAMIGGILLINALNIVRIAGLTVISFEAPKYLFLAHDHLFNILVFVSLFLFVYFLIKYGDQQFLKESQTPS